MNDHIHFPSAKPTERPRSPNFSSGPCAKHPGWNIARLSTQLLGRSHRSKEGKNRLSDAIQLSRKLLGVPHDWVVGIVPGSGTGAIEFALWNLLGPRHVDVIVSDGFSAYWADDVRKLMGPDATIHKGAGRTFPRLGAASSEHDVVFVYNGTGNGVCAKDLEWVSEDRKGLVIADATSAAFSMPLDFSKLDAVTWSWQKGLGSEAGQGMVALGPAALKRATSRKAGPPCPKLLNFCQADGTALLNLFEGHTISTPSMLALEDLHSALDWARAAGGAKALYERVERNYRTIDAWVQRTEWIDWLAPEDCRSKVSLCLRIVQPMDKAEADSVAKSVIGLLEAEGAAHDIFTMHDAPPGFRIWGGPTVEAADLHRLTRWLDWAFAVTTDAVYCPEATEGGDTLLPVGLTANAGSLMQLVNYAGGASHVQP